MDWVDTKTGSRLTGKTEKNFVRQMERHGVKRNAAGEYRADQALAAAALGARLDKRKAAAELEMAVSNGATEDSLVYRAKMAQLRKVTLQGDVLEAERDKLLGKLADVDEIADRVMRRDTSLAQMVNTLRDSEIAKRPDLREEITRICDAVRNALGASIDER